MKSQYFVKVSPIGHQPKLIEVVGSLTNSPRSRNFSTMRFSKSKKISKSLSIRPSPVKELIKLPTVIKRRSHADDLKHYISNFPNEIEDSEKLVKRIQKDHNEYDPKSFKIRLTDMINRKRFNVDSERVNLLSLPDTNTDDKYFLKCYRFSESKPKQKSNVLLDLVPLIDSKQVNLEMKKSIMSLASERQNLEKALKNAIAQTKNKKRFFNGVKTDNIEAVRMELEQDPGLITELYALKQTALHIACKNNYNNLIKLLLEYNADPLAKDMVIDLAR